MLQALAEDLYDRGGLDLSERFIDGSFTHRVPGREKRGTKVGPTKRGKGTKIMALADRAGLPLAIHIESASPHEVTLVEPTLAANVIDTPPEHLIGDKAYDSDPMDARLAADGSHL